MWNPVTKFCHLFYFITRFSSRTILEIEQRRQFHNGFEIKMSLFDVKSRYEILPFVLLYNTVLEQDFLYRRTWLCWQKLKWLSVPREGSLFGNILNQRCVRMDGGNKFLILAKNRCFSGSIWLQSRVWDCTAITTEIWLLVVKSWKPVMSWPVATSIPVFAI